MLLKLIVILELAPMPKLSSMRMARPAPSAILLQLIDKPLTPPKMRMSAVAASVELCMLLVEIDDEVTLASPIARRFELNSLFEKVLFAPPAFTMSIALLVLPTNLLLWTTTLVATKFTSIPVPPSGPGLLLFWIRL